MTIVLLNLENLHKENMEDKGAIPVNEDEDKNIEEEYDMEDEKIDKKI